MVMKKSQRKHLRRTIQKNIVSFLAVALMVATGVSIYLGDQSGALAILKRADRYFAENKLASFSVSCAYGITEEDVEAMAGWEGVDEAEGGYSSAVMLKTDRKEGNILIQAHSLLKTMNLPVVLEGELPVSEQEAAIEQIMAEKEGIKVGDTIVLKQDGALKNDTFKVTAIVNEPSYCCAKAKDARGKSEIGIGSAYYYIALPESAFDTSYFDDCYTTAYIRNDKLDDYFYFSDAYKKQEQIWKDCIEELGEKRAAIRYEEVKQEAKQSLKKAEDELEKQRKNLEDAHAMLSYIFEWIGLSGDLQEAKRQLDEFGNLKEPLLAVIEQYEEAETALKKAPEELAQAKEKIEDMQLQSWVVSTRNDIGDVRSIETIVEGLYGLSYSMAIIFVIVSVTVCYAAISRMISEQRSSIGMQKALGFTAKEIMRHYMSYSILCGLFGILEGWIAAYVIVEGLDLKIYQSVFLLDRIPRAFSWTHAILVSVFFMVIFVAAAYAACAKEIALPATCLLRGDMPEREKPFAFEKLGIYQKLRLYTRTMIKNVFADRSRMLTTVMGIAGCITLLVICFSLLITMEESSAIQFERYFLYENRLVIDTSEGDIREFEACLEEENIDHVRIQDKLKLCREGNENWSAAHVVAVSDTQDITDFMVLEDPVTGEIQEIPEEGVLVSIKCADQFGLKEGSAVKVMDANGSIREVTVAGIIEHYLGYNLFVTSTEYYEKVMEEEADECVFLLKGDVDGLYEKVKDLDGFISLRDNSEYDSMGNVMDMVVMVCFVFAAIMAVLVMLNQNVMHINQKARELSVMRINGFTLKETKAFVSRDNFVLTLLGIGLGWAVGMALSCLVIRVLEVSVTHYIRTPSFKACIIAALIGGFFAFLMNRIALRRILHLNLTNVNAN